MMNSNRYTAKLTSVILCIMLLFSVMPTVGLASSEEHILLSSDNFVFSGTYSQVVADGLSDKIFQNIIKVQRFDAVTAKFYVSEAGEYAVWCLTGSSSDDTARVPKVTIGDETKTLPHSKALSWNKEIWELSAGLNEISITTAGEWTPYFLDAMYITNNLSVEITTSNDDDLLAYTDTAAPEFASDADIQTNFDGSICSITFPEATDGENTSLYYEYTLNGSAVAIADINESVNVGSIEEDTTVTLTVYDKVGHKAEKTFDITAPVLPDLPEGENILLSGENFNVPAYSGGGYIANGGSATENLFANSMKINENGDSNYSTARVYIKETGTYNLWVLSGNENDATDRYAKVGFDSQDMKTVSYHKTHQWDKTEWTLEAGWHELKVGIVGSWKPVVVNALYITDDLIFVPDVATDEALLAYHDTEAPEFASDSAIQTAFDGSVCTITFPEATDGGNTTLYYEYTLNGSTKAIADIKAGVNVGSITEDTTVTLTAYDKFGNKAEKSFGITAPEIEPDNPDNPDEPDNPDNPDEPDSPIVPDEPSDSDGFMLTYKNFDVPAFSNGGIESAVTGALADSNIKVNGGDISLYATAKFYIKAEGDYSLWLLSGNSDNIAERHPVAYIDNNKDLSSFNATKTLTWNKGKGADGSGVYHLTAGWHTVKLGLSGTWLPYLVNAVYITNNLSFEVTRENEDELLAEYGDTEAPAFEKNEVEVNYTDSSACIFNFPEITDDSAISGANYYINDELVDVTDGSFAVSNLKPLEKLSLKVEAYDKFGNKAVLEEEYIASPVKTSGFEMKKNGEAAVTDISELAAGDTVKLNSKLSNRTAGGITVEVSLCLYSANYERMLKCETVEVTLSANAVDVAADVTLTLPEDFVNTAGGIISTTVWDKASGEPYIEGLEIKGAE